MAGIIEMAYVTSLSGDYSGPKNLSTEHQVWYGLWANFRSGVVSRTWSFIGHLYFNGHFDDRPLSMAVKIQFILLLKIDFSVNAFGWYFFRIVDTKYLVVA